MSDELYYRGSSSYETAVKNRLNELERSGVKNTAAMLSGIQNMEYGIRGEIRESTCAIIASQSILAESFKDSFNSVNNTLNIGFEMIAAGMGQLADSINAMSEAICNKLDEIHDIVNNPLLTASRELFRRASANFEKGYFEEALEDCKAAVEKNKTDYISWYLLGQIYLFGAGEFSNVIDLRKAEDAFLNAAKYIDADLPTDGRVVNSYWYPEVAKQLGIDIEGVKEVAVLGSQIYYYLGYTRLLLSNDLLVEEKTDDSNKKLEEAQKASKNSSYLNNRNVKALYDNAKELHFLGKDEEAIAALKNAIRLEKNFALVAANDKNFESIWSDIEKAVLELRDELVQECRSELKDIDKFFVEEKSAESIAESRSEYEKKIESIKDKDLFTVSKFFEKELKPYCLDAEKVENFLKFARYLKSFFEEAEMGYLGLVSEFFSGYTKLAFIDWEKGEKICDILSKLKIITEEDEEDDDDNFIENLNFGANSYFAQDKLYGNAFGESLCSEFSIYIDGFAKYFEGLFNKIDRDDKGELCHASTKTFPEISAYLCEFNKKLKCKEITEILKEIDEIHARDSDRLQAYKKFSEDNDRIGISKESSEKDLSCWGTVSVGKEIEDIYSSLSYSSNELIDSAEISDGVKKLRENAFLCCKSLKSVKLPDSLEVIGKDAFLGCKNLKTINIPDSVKEIIEGAFAGCDNLDEETKAKIANLEVKEKVSASSVVCGVLSAILTFFELLLVSKYHPVWAGILSLASLFMTLCSCQKSRLNKVLGFAHLVIGVWLFSGAGFVDGSHKILAVINILASLLHFFMKL